MDPDMAETPEVVAVAKTSMDPVGFLSMSKLASGTGMLPGVAFGTLFSSCASVTADQRKLAELSFLEATEAAGSSARGVQERTLCII
jgi:hypothetical protein